MLLFPGSEAGFGFGLALWLGSVGWGVLIAEKGMIMRIRIKLWYRTGVVCVCRLGSLRHVFCDLERFMSVEWVR